MSSGISNASSHELNLLHKLTSMRKEETSTDFIIKVEGKFISVHRVILTACADYFKALFSARMMETESGVVHTKGLKSEDVELCLDYMYTGEAAVTMDNIRGVLKTADMWQFHELREQCVIFLQQNLSVESCLEVMFIAEDFSMGWLASLAEQCALDNFSEIINTDGFKDLDLQELLNLIEKVSEETEIIWKAVILWSKFNGYELAKELFEFFSFDRCSFEFLYQNVLVEPMVSENEHYVQTVVKKLAPFITKDNLTLDNCLYMLHLTDRCIGPAVRFVILRYVKDHIGDVYDKDEFFKLRVSDILTIFSLLKWNKPEKLQWTALRKWIKAEKKSRKKEITDILEKCVLPTADFYFIRETLVCDSLIKKSTENLKLVLSELFGRMLPQHITKENWLSLVQFAEKLKGERQYYKAIDKITGFFILNFSHLVAEDDMLTIDDITFLRMLKGATKVKVVISARYPEDDIEYAKRVNISEKEIWSALCRWLAFDVTSRLPSMEKFIMSLNLQQFSFKFLFGTLLKDWIMDEMSDGARLRIISTIFSVMRNSDLNQENCFEILNLARKHPPYNIRKIVHSVLNYMSQNFAVITNNLLFCRIQCSDFLELMQSPYSNQDLEAKWKASIKWIRHDPKLRKRYLPIALKMISLENLSPNFIRDHIYSDELVEKSSFCNKMIIKALLKNKSDDEASMKYDDHNT